MKTLSKIIRSALHQRGKADVPQIGNVSPICPYCGNALERKPTRKRKCPECGQTIYVKKRPSDGILVLVTARQARQIDEQRERLRELREWEKRRKDPEFASIERQLRKQWGKDPSLSDVLWALANKRLMQHASNGDWGLYRNVKLEMAEILRKWSRRPREALQFYLEVFYLDLNGPVNTGGNRRVKPFDQRQAFIAPVVVRRIRRLAKKADVTPAELRQMLIRAAETVGPSGLPVGPQTCWRRLRDYMQAR